MILRNGIGARTYFCGLDLQCDAFGTVPAQVVADACDDLLLDPDPAPNDRSAFADATDGITVFMPGPW